jgi:hypothetical protein
MRAPSSAWRRISAHSASLSGPGFSRITSEIPSLPTSCRWPATRRRRAHRAPARRRTARRGRARYAWRRTARGLAARTTSAARRPGDADRDRHGQRAVAGLLGHGAAQALRLSRGKRDSGHLAGCDRPGPTLMVWRLAICRADRYPRLETCFPFLRYRWGISTGVALASASGNRGRSVWTSICLVCLVCLSGPAIRPGAALPCGELRRRSTGGGLGVP